MDNVQNDVDKEILVGAVFIDLRKGFDTLSHDVLLTKLKVYGMKGRELAWFTDYLFGQQQYVQLGIASYLHSLHHRHRIVKGEMSLYHGAD